MLNLLLLLLADFVVNLCVQKLNHTSSEDSTTVSPTHQHVMSPKRKSATLQDSNASGISELNSSGASSTFTSSSSLLANIVSSSASNNPQSIIPPKGGSSSSSNSQEGFATLRPHTLLSKQQEDHALQNELRDQMNVYKRMRTQHQKQVCMSIDMFFVYALHPPHTHTRAHTHTSHACTRTHTNIAIR